MILNMVLVKISIFQKSKWKKTCSIIIYVYTDNSVEETVIDNWMPPCCDSAVETIVTSNCGSVHNDGGL